MTDPPFKPKAIIFDLLTALLNSWDIWDAVIPPSERYISSTPGTTWRKQYLNITFACGAYKPYEDLVHQAAKDVGLSDEAPKALLARYDETGPWPEVPGVLGRLREMGYRLGVVTNCSDELGRRTVERVEKLVRQETGNSSWAFDAIVTAEESGYYKPQKKPYHDTLEKLSVSAEEALFVAGSAFDIEGATDAGMRVVWNNHVGLERQGAAMPLREGKELGEALRDFLG